MHSNLLLLRQVPCCSLPRCLTSAAASTSSSSACAASASSSSTAALACAANGRTSSSAHRPQLNNHLSSQHSLQPQHNREAVVARVTGKREEYAIEGIRDPEDIWGEEAEEEFIEVDTVPMWSPERGRYNQRIFRDADDERETKEISIEDTAYWFAENNAGELPRTQMVRRMKELEPQTADEMLQCEDVEGCPPRLRLSELEEGDELAGIVTDIWLWHGAFVDVLADFKGLIPIRQTEWPFVHDNLLPGTEVVVRVHKINEYPKFRFPLQLELLTPEEVIPNIMAPDEYKVPANIAWMYEQGMDITEVTKDLGLPYEDQEYLLEPDHGDWMENIAFSYGKDDPGLEYYPGDWLSRELNEKGTREEVQKIVADE